VRGTVTAFDEPRGWGELVTADGRTLPFHCTQIADGTRTIDVGTVVEHDVRPGGLGRWEAGQVTKLATG
jgi:cold shock CspA family protein